ncbi:MAG TPA: YCF48-related protein [Methylibium sp.]|nr:YCF48-related protein [Methylibium sp.]
MPALATPKASGAAILALARAGQRLVAVGERGIVLLSDDEGTTWRQAEVPVSVTLTGVQFVDARRGWAIGHLGVVLHTQDGGARWVRQLDGVRAAALALEAEQAAGVARGTAKSLVDDGPDKPLLDLHFENERVGWVVGAYSLAFRTEDGGKSWQSVMGRLPNPKGLHLYVIRAVGDALYVAGEQGLLLRSMDQGRSFESLPSPSKGSYFGLVCGRQGALLLYGLRGRAFLSSDGAASWSEVDTGTRASLSAGLTLASGALLLASQAGELLLSRDGGRSFKPIANGRALPVTALLQSGADKLVAGSLRGVRKLDLAADLS